MPEPEINELSLDELKDVSGGLSSPKHVPKDIKKDKKNKFASGGWEDGWPRIAREKG